MPSLFKQWVPTNIPVPQLSWLTTNPGLPGGPGGPVRKNPPLGSPFSPFLPVIPLSPFSPLKRTYFKRGAEVRSELCPDLLKLHKISELNREKHLLKIFSTPLLSSVMWNEKECFLSAETARLFRAGARGGGVRWRQRKCLGCCFLLFYPGKLYSVLQLEAKRKPEEA